MRPLIFAAGFAAGLAVSMPFVAAAWTAPTGTPPNNDAAAPLNVSSNLQEKTGPLTVDGNLLVGGSAGSNNYLNFGATSGSGGYGIWDNNGTLNFKSSGGSWASLQSIICGYVSCTGGGGGTITGVTAGTNMTGGGTSGTVTLSTSMTPTFTSVTAMSTSGNAVRGSSQGAAAWSGCFGSDCTGGTATQYGVYGNGTVDAGYFNGPVTLNGNVSIPGSTYGLTVGGPVSFNSGYFSALSGPVGFGLYGLYSETAGAANAIIGESAGYWSGCFGTGCHDSLATSYGVYAHGSTMAGEFDGPVTMTQNLNVTGDIYSGSRNMWMSETARDDGAQFIVNPGVGWTLCPSGSVTVGVDISGSSAYLECQWIN